MRRISIYGPSLIVLGTAVLVLLAGPRAVWQLTYEHTKARIVQARQGLDENPVLQQLNQAYRDIATMVEPSVVHISTERTLRSFGEERLVGSSGSGWVWDELGHIVTNSHVVEGADRIEVQLSTGEMRQAELVGDDRFTDVAVIRIPPSRLFPAVRAEPDPDGRPHVRQGDLVFAFGSPFDFRFSMSSGIVSGIGRSVGVIGDGVGYENFIQVDAAINPGNSGGPLTDAQGRVIGMNTAIATSTGGGIDEGQFGGIGLAIPLDMIEPVVTQIITTGTVQKGFLGVAVLDRSEPLVAELNGLGFRGYGLAVARIEPDNPALDAGLKVGDVLMQINDENVATRAQLEAATRDVEPDDDVYVNVWRYDEELDQSGRVRLVVPGVVAKGFRGVWLMQLDDQISDWLELQGFSGRGVRIAHVELGLPARQAGLKARDVVTHVNSEPIGSVAQLRSRISSMLPGDMAQLEIWRYEPRLGRGQRRDIDVELDRLNTVRVTGTIPPHQEQQALEELGIARMATSTPALADQFGIVFRRGVLVQELVEDSPVAGTVTPGSIIVAVMDRPVHDVEDFFRILSNYNLRSGVRITIVRADGKLSTTVLRVQ